MSIIRTEHIKYKFRNRNENNEVISENVVLNDVNIDIEQGDFVAILGHNGSGKSTLARHFNALLLPNEGSVFVDGEDSKIVEELWRIREKCGMVFQNPDNQIVGVTVEEDVGFGPENLGIKCDEIWNRVNDSLNKVDMYQYRKKSPNHLSGGQKQRVAIASSLAMLPKCIVLDEPTAMLDPKGRSEVMQIIKELNESHNITIILITHHMNEAIMAKRVIVLDNGKIMLEGSPREVFKNIDKIKELKLDVPQIMELSYDLYKNNIIRRYDLLNVDEFVEQFKNDQTIKIFNNINKKVSKEKKIFEKKCILKLSNVNLLYEAGNNMEVQALENINMTINENEFIGIIGHTGSGKSSLVQIMNGLISQTSGDVLYYGENIHKKGFDSRSLHCNVGLVFQYPESQLFEETVLKDVMFGPINKKMSDSDAKQAAKEALSLFNIDEKYYNKSPFELSGGEMRRVAIAGVIAMNPEIIILDEPTAGLDPESRNNLLNSLKRLKYEKNKTIVIVSHNMEDMANYVDRLIVMHDGQIVYDDEKRKVFGYAKELLAIGLDVPEVTKAMIKLKECGYDVDNSAITIEEVLRGMGINA